MTRVYLHIGTPKTGTTAIQSFLSINREQLLNKNYLYPLTGTHTKDYNNTRFANHILLNRAIMNQLALLSSDNLQKKEQDSLTQEWDKLINEINSKSKDNVILSMEGFSGYPFEGTKLLGQYLSNYDVKVIVYLRQQDKFIQSLYNQVVKLGICSDNIHQFIKEKQPQYIDYENLLKDFAEVFGKENLIVRIYEKEQLKNKDLIQDFIDAIDYREYDDLTNGVLTTVALANESPSVKTIKLMRLLNGILPNQIFFFKEIRRKVNKTLLKLSLKNERLTTKIFLNILDLFIKNTDDVLLSTEDKIEIMKKYEESNLAVAKEYFGRENTGLFYSNLIK